MQHAPQNRRRLAAASLAVACALVTVATTTGTSSAAPERRSESAASAQKSGKATPAQGKAARHKKGKKQRQVEVQLLSFNDFHGNLEEPTGSGGRIVVDHAIDPKTGKPADVNKDAGGSEFLATHLQQAREGHPRSLTVAAGDLIGGSPLLSAAFHDEPAIESLNELGLDVAAVGNHEFDEGYKELLRIDRGGCLDDGDGANNQNSCPDGSFAGAGFDYLAANVKYAGSKETILPPYVIKDLDGARVAFIGMTLEGTPNIVTAAGVAGLSFTDEVETANALVPKLRKKGVEAIVVLLHEGGLPTREKWTDPATGVQYDVNPTYDYTCGKGGSLAPTSPILPIAANLDPAIDMIVTGHTHQPYVCSVKDPANQDRLLTSASSAGRLFTETTLTYDRRTRDIVRSSVKGANVLVTRDVQRDATQSALIAKYRELVAPIAGEVIGSISRDVTNTANPAGESELGDLIADAQLADPSTVTGGEVPRIAFMNPGGIRGSLSYSTAKYGEAPGEVTYEEAFTVQPFNNFLVSMTLTGEQIYTLLTQQVTGANAASSKILQVSKGFSYRYTSTGPVPGSVMLDGEPITPTGTYRIVTNNFLADGGDGFPVFKDGANRYYGGLDIDAFADYLDALPGAYTPGPLTRITKE